MTKDEREFLGRGCAFVLLIASGATVMVTGLAIACKVLGWVILK